MAPRRGDETEAAGNRADGAVSRPTAEASAGDVA
jgi:hypothetical protein